MDEEALLPARWGPEAILQEFVKSGSLHSLTLDKKRMLAALLECRTTKDAATSIGITVQRHNSWVRFDPVYREAVDGIGNGLLMEARARLDALMPKAAEAFEDALDAEKSLHVVCPSCEHEFSIRIADERLRIAVAKELFKRSGDLADKVKHEGDLKVRNMDLEDRIALAQVAKGGPGAVPPQVLQGLKARGLYDPTSFAAPRIDQATHAGAIDGEIVNS